MSGGGIGTRRPSAAGLGALVSYRRHGDRPFVALRPGASLSSASREPGGPRRCLLILGMHRSGTSALAGLCRILGAHLGSRLLEPNAFNPSGYWEHTEVHAVHTNFLEAIGSRWDDVRPLPPECFSSETADAYRRELEALLEGDLGAPLALVKDPRLCRLLPLWRPVLERLRIEPAFVLPMREPSEVIASLQRREGFSTARAAVLWLRHLVEAERATRGSPRVFLDYEDLLRDWAAAARRIAGDLGFEWPRTLEAAAADVAGFLRPALRHHRPDGSLLRELPLLANALARGCQAQGHAVADPAAGGPLFDEAAAALDEVGDLAASLVDALEGDGLAAQRHLRRHQAHHRRQHRASRRALAESEARALEASRSAETVANELESVRDQLAARTVTIDRLEDDARALALERDHARRELESLTQRTARLGGELADARRELLTVRAVAAEQSAMLQGIFVSKSWRLTKPMRDARRALDIALGRPTPSARPRPALPDLEPAHLAGRLDLPAEIDPASLALPAPSTTPTVSVIVPVHGQLPVTLRCLASIAATPPVHDYELLLVDDASPDDSARLADVPNLRYLRNGENLGFLRSCNRAAGEARGELLHFLNNDTLVREGWLDELVRTFRDHPDAGIAGSLLLFPDGRVQEAGGIVWEDGSGWNFGRGGDPEDPQYGYLREVDYVSGASLMVPRQLFGDLGGFDTDYAPAYYEDVDLAFRVRRAGRRVYYQPLSRVVHVEGVSSGTDPDRGAKAYQRVNAEKFRARWSEALRGLGDSSRIGVAKERAVRRRALVVDATTPTPDRDAGSACTLQMLRILMEVGYKVSFIPESNLAHFGEYTRDLQRQGVECLYAPFVPSVRRYLEERGADFDLVVLCRGPASAPHMQDVRRLCPRAKVVLNTIDLHFLREQRQAELTGSDAERRAADITRRIELDAMRRADAAIVVSSFERDLIEPELEAGRLFCIPFAREVRGRSRGFGGRRDVVFLGGFQHPANGDAVRYFATEVWPLVRAQAPDLVFHVVGDAPPPDVAALESRPGVKIVGYVRDLGDYFDRCLVCVAPLRFGAGLKGKVLTSLSYGVPCALTPVASEGLPLGDALAELVASTPEAFADLVVRLTREEPTWERLSQAGMAMVSDEFSYAREKERYVHLLDAIGATRD